MPLEKNTFTVSRKIPHHASHSGYDQLSRYLGSPVGAPKWIYRIRGLGLIHRHYRKKSGMEWYNGLYSELFTSLHMRKRRGQIYHFLFGENEFRFLPEWMPDRQHKVIGTYHTPPAEFETVMKQTAHLRRLDAVIVVASNQLPVLENILSKEKVFLIPHGVDTEYFVPPAKRFESKTCICVGHHHRDFATLGRAAAILKKMDPEIHILVVDRVFSHYLSSEQQNLYKGLFASAGNVELLTDISDEELLRLYQTSALMILPLIDTTANVAVLEALSSALPMVVSDVGGIRDYVSTDCAALASPGDAEDIANQTLTLLQNSAEREKLSRLSRQQALLFDWKIIAKKIETLRMTL
jgi:glycosyltransferase involved in cell wall biosynthesis